MTEPSKNRPDLKIEHVINMIKQLKRDIDQTRLDNVNGAKMVEKQLTVLSAALAEIERLLRELRE